jgi:hypothetical protein
MTTATKPELKVADEVWIVVALLHRERPERSDFSIDEIMERARAENLHGSLRSGLYVHIIQHCVANRPPNPARYRMLIETANGRRRLFRKGDAYHPQREGGKLAPQAGSLPYGYSGLLQWYEDWCAVTAKAKSLNDELLSLAGSGRRLWADEHADEYINRLRAGWK